MCSADRTEASPARGREAGEAAQTRRREAGGAATTRWQEAGGAAPTRRQEAGGAAPTRRREAGGAATTLRSAAGGTGTTRDLRQALTISAAVGVVGVSFGALAPSAGLSPAMTMAMSALVFAGGAQLLVIGVLAAGGGLVPAVLAGLVLNLRHLPFGLALAPIVGRGPARVLAAHVVTDESTAFVLSRSVSGHQRARRAFWMLGVIKFACWQAGTAIGLALGSVVADPSVLGIDAAFPAALVAMLFPLLRASDARRVGAGAAAVSLAVGPFLPAGLPVLAGLLAVPLGVLRRRRGAGSTADRTDDAGCRPGGAGCRPGGVGGRPSGVGGRAGCAAPSRPGDDAHPGPDDDRRPSRAAGPSVVRRLLDSWERVHDRMFRMPGGVS